MKPYDNVEVAGVKVKTGDGICGRYCEKITGPNTKPDYWSVYLWRVGTGIDLIADVFDKETAQQIARMLWLGIPKKKRLHQIHDETF